jgi:transposase
LALAAGKSYSQIESELNTSRPTIARWRKRFEEEGIAGLNGQHRGSKPTAASPTVQARLIRKTLQKPEDGTSTVQRIWSQTRLKPHRLDRYMASNDPNSKPKRRISSACTRIRRSMQPCLLP